MKSTHTFVSTPAFLESLVRRKVLSKLLLIGLVILVIWRLADAIIASLDCFFGAEPAAGAGGELDAGAGSAAPPDADNGATPTTEEGNGS